MNPMRIDSKEDLAYSSVLVVIRLVKWLFLSIFLVCLVFSPIIYFVQWWKTGPALKCLELPNPVGTKKRRQKRKAERRRKQCR